MEMNPRTLLDRTPVEFDEVSEGMWLAKSSWTRPRLVIAQEKQSYIVLAEPDPARQDEYGNRRVSAEEFAASAWRTFPVLNQVWKAAFAE